MATLIAGGGAIAGEHRLADTLEVGITSPKRDAKPSAELQGRQRKARVKRHNKRRLLHSLTGPANTMGDRHGLPAVRPNRLTCEKDAAGAFAANHEVVERLPRELVPRRPNACSGLPTTVVGRT
jgi:hypothetical protein